MLAKLFIFCFIISASQFKPKQKSTDQHSHTHTLKAIATDCENCEDKCESNGSIFACKLTLLSLSFSFPNLHSTCSKLCVYPQCPCSCKLSAIRSAIANTTAKKHCKLQLQIFPSGDLLLPLLPPLKVSARAQHNTAQHQR